jgi:hypothetical protein
LIMNYTLSLFVMRAMCKTNYPLMLFDRNQTILCGDLVIIFLLF